MSVSNKSNPAELPTDAAIQGFVEGYRMALLGRNRPTPGDAQWGRIGPPELLQPGWDAYARTAARNNIEGLTQQDGIGRREFAVWLALEELKPIPAIADLLCVGRNTVTRWVRAAQKEKQDNDQEIFYDEG